MDNKIEAPNIIVEEPGHVYQLKNFEKVYNGLGQVGDTKDLDSTYQTISFIHKEPVKKEGIIEDTMELVSNGTTNEIVIEMLIDRISYLDKRIPSEFNKQAIVGLNNVLDSLKARTQERIDRNIEGQFKS